jgi:hypothetical protein
MQNGTVQVMGLYPIGSACWFVSYRAYEEDPDNKHPLNLEGLFLDSILDYDRSSYQKQNPIID